MLKNFDIQLFAVEHGFSGRKNLAGVPLRDREVLVPLAFDAPLSDEGLVEDFFEIFFDQEIPGEIICEYINDQSQGVFSDLLVECDDIISEQEPNLDVDVYSGLTDGEPGEVC